MRKRFALLVAVSGIVGALSVPSASLAACNDGTSQARDEFGNVTGADTLATTPNGSTVYGDGAESQLNPGYLGVTGGAGYIEISGNADDAPNVQVDGAESGGNVEGRAGVDTGAGEADACVNGTEVL